MKRIELPKWLVIIPLVAIGFALLFVAATFLGLGIRHYSAYVSNAEADAIAYRNKKLTESIDDKVLAWEKIRNCKE